MENPLLFEYKERIIKLRQDMIECLMFKLVCDNKSNTGCGVEETKPVRPILLLAFFFIVYNQSECLATVVTKNLQSCINK